MRPFAFLIFLTGWRAALHEHQGVKMPVSGAQADLPWMPGKKRELADYGKAEVGCRTRDRQLQGPVKRPYSICCRGQRDFCRENPHFSRSAAVEKVFGVNMPDSPR